MLRRFVIVLLMLGTWLHAIAGHAQAPETARLGVVWPVGFSETPIDALWERMRQLGWEEGRNLIVERRSAEGIVERLPALMSDVLSKKVDVILTLSTPGAVAARNATASVPIVAAAVGDPVEAGLAASLARPGGNLTGLSYGFSQGFHGKWIELLRECVPQLKSVAVMYNPQNPWSNQQRKMQEASVVSLGLKAQSLAVTSNASLAATFAQARRNAQGLILVADPLTYQLREEFATMALRHRLPMMAPMLEFAEAGALMSYGVDNTAVMRRMAEYVDRILRGAKPGDIPIEQATLLTLAVNLKTAGALGIAIPPAVLERADRIIR